MRRVEWFQFDLKRACARVSVKSDDATVPEAGILASVEDSASDEIERTSGTNDEGAAVGMEVRYGSTVFFVGSGVYFYLVEQQNNYRCTTQSRHWPRVNGSQLVRRCSGTGRWIYQLI